MLCKIAAIPLIVLGLMFVVIESPGVWADYRVDQTRLSESAKFDPPDGGCSPNFGFFITCGFAVVHSDTGKVTHFDYIHVKSGMPKTIAAVPLQNDEETVLNFSYGLQMLPQRMLVLVIGAVLILLGYAILRLGRCQSLRVGTSTVRHVRK